MEWTTPGEAVNPFKHQCYWCERETAWHRTVQHGDDVYYCFDHFNLGEVMSKERGRNGVGKED